jgi:hypothetical protein
MRLRGRYTTCMGSPTGRIFNEGTSFFLGCCNAASNVLRTVPVGSQNFEMNVFVTVRPLKKRAV